jgi:hypothetical protein
MKHRTLIFTGVLALLVLTFPADARARKASDSAQEASVTQPPALPAGLSIVPSGLGITLNTYGFPRPGEMRMLNETGIRWIRTDFVWEDTEKADGYHFGSYDDLMNELGQNVRLIFILDYDNPLYERNGNNAPDTVYEQQKFTRWARAAVEHFKGRGIIWELYNEPDLDISGKSSLSKERYASLALMVGRMLRQYYPNEIFVGPALSRMPSDFYTKQRDFLKYCFQQGLLNYWSAVSIHPYRDGAGPPETVTEDYRYLRNLIRQYEPNRRVPIISSEWGYSSRPVTDSDTGNLNRDQTQAKLLAREWLINLYNRIPISTWYSWHDSEDQPGDTPDEINQRHFGLVRFPYYENREPVYNRKPAYFAAKTLTRNLSGWHFDKRLTLYNLDSHLDTDKRDYALLFSGYYSTLIVAWTTSATPRTVRVRVPVGNYTVTTYLGQQLPGYYVADSNGLEIKLEDGPKYIRESVPQ